MTALQAVFRTTDVVAVREWEAAGRTWGHWQRKIDAARAAWFGTAHEDYPPYLARSAFSGTTLAGFGAPSGSTPPDGWRAEKAYPHPLVPARSTKAGKVVAKRFDALRNGPNPRKVLEYFGMPTFTMTGLHVCTYTANVVAGVLWVGWPCDMPDMGEWERVPLSTYYALVEGGADPFTGDNEREAE